jgi:hypothetical protein
LNYKKLDISKLNKTDLENKKILLEKEIKNIEDQAKIKSKSLLVKLPTFKYKLDEIKNNFSKKIN